MNQLHQFGLSTLYFDSISHNYWSAARTFTQYRETYKTLRWPTFTWSGLFRQTGSDTKQQSREDQFQNLPSVATYRLYDQISTQKKTSVYSGLDRMKKKKLYVSFSIRWKTFATVK